MLTVFRSYWFRDPDMRRTKPVRARSTSRRYRPCDRLHLTKAHRPRLPKAPDQQETHSLHFLSRTRGLPGYEPNLDHLLTNAVGLVQLEVLFNPGGQQPMAARSSPVNKRPDPTWISALAVLASAEVLLTLIGGYSLNCVVALFGLLGAPVLLGSFRLKENRLQKGSRYSDWFIRARHVAASLTAFSWFLGLLNVFFVAKEWSR